MFLIGDRVRVLKSGSNEKNVGQTATIVGMSSDHEDSWPLLEADGSFYNYDGDANDRMYFHKDNLEKI